MASNKTYRVAVGSTNPIKRSASEKGVKDALQAYHDSNNVNADQSKNIEVLIDSQCFSVPSGVSDQPNTDVETKTGAINRARSVWTAYQEANSGTVCDYAIGLEGGVTDDGEEMLCSAWMAVFNGESVGTARTCSFSLPPEIRSLVLGGMELGHADDKVFKRVNSKQSDGAVGLLSRGVIDRSTYYAPAVVLAMVPLLWPDLYPPATAISSP
jgi:inosine/xanthosine triphosphatase